MASTLRFDNWEDSNGTPILDGTNLALPSSALPAGTVLQVVSTTYSTQTETNSTSYVDTGLSLSITPSSIDSKIFIITSQQGYGYETSNNTYTQFDFALLRNTSNIFQTRSHVLGRGATSAEYFTVSGDISYLDSPSTTSIITYKTQMAQSVNGVGYVGVQRQGFDSSMTLMEIAG